MSFIPSKSHAFLAAGAALALAIGACGQQDQGGASQSGTTADTSAEPDMTQPAPDDSTYSASAGRTEDTAAGMASAGGDADFVQNAAQTDMLEIQAGQLASDKGQSPEVKKFAGMLVKDHEAASKQLQQIAQNKDVQIPQTLSPDKQQSLQKLQGMSGAEFDKAFSQEMVNGHEKAVQMYEQAAQSAQDPEIRAFAEEKLPTLREHLKLAQSLPGADNQG
jgi:putative membrane protein